MCSAIESYFQREYLEKRLEDISVYYEIMSSVMLLLDPKEVLDVFLERVAGRFRCEVGIIYLLENGNLHVSSCFGLSPEKLNTPQNILSQELIADTLAGNARDLTEDDRSCLVLHPVLSEKAKAIFIAPICLKEQTLGILQLCRFQNDPFTHKEKRMLISLLERFVVAINHATLYTNLEDLVKKRTAELEKKTQELQKTMEELRTAQAQLIQSEKLASIGQLAAGVSHELNNPLAGILGYAQFMLEKIKKNEEAGEFTPENITQYINYLQTIEHAAQRCKTIVANLLKFSRESKAEASLLDINQVLEDTFSFTQHQLEMNNIELIKRLGEGLPRVLGNEHQLEQVFTNLILNAKDAMANGGRLTVSTTAQDGYIYVSFADTGCGIPEDKLGKIFDPFFTTKEVGEGTGLGLSVSYGIIREHKGKITVESQEGKGTTFKIILPKATG
jgi:signal transduction histidine kinase